MGTGQYFPFFADIWRAPIGIAHPDTLFQFLRPFRHQATIIPGMLHRSLCVALRTWRESISLAYLIEPFVAIVAIFPIRVIRGQFPILPAVLPLCLIHS